MIGTFDLGELQEKARRAEFYGETIIRWEKGEPVFIEAVQKFKPKDFNYIVFAAFKTVA